MLRQLVAVDPQPAEVHDLPDTGAGSGSAECPGALGVALLEVGGVEGVDQVVRRVAPGERGVERCGVAYVTADGRRHPPIGVGMPGQAAHPVACSDKGRHQTTTHEAGRAGHQHPHPARSSRRRLVRLS